MTSARRPIYVHARPRGGRALSPARRALVVAVAVLVEAPLLVSALARLGG